VIAPAAASFLVPWRDLLCNASFVLLSIGSAVVPTVLFALFSPEFPLVAGETLGRGGGRGGGRGAGGRGSCGLVHGNSSIFLGALKGHTVQCWLCTGIISNCLTVAAGAC
jgi:hypothetical protein